MSKSHTDKYSKRPQSASWLIAARLVSVDYTTNCSETQRKRFSCPLLSLNQQFAHSLSHHQRPLLQLTCSADSSSGSARVILLTVTQTPSCSLSVCIITENMSKCAVLVEERKEQQQQIFWFISVRFYLSRNKNQPWNVQLFKHFKRGYKHIIKGENSS